VGLSSTACAGEDFGYATQHVKTVAFGDLVRLPLVTYYEDAFRKATGVSLKLAPPEEPKKFLAVGKCANPFCTLVSRTPVGNAACLEAEVFAHRTVASRRVTYQSHCFARMTIVAMPVMIGG